MPLLSALLCGWAAVLPAVAAPGSTGASFLRFTPSPRATGMGESQVSVTQDAYSAYWNPAGLAAVEAPELAAMYNVSFEDVNTQYLAAAYPLQYGSTLGLGISRLAVAPFQGYDSLGVKTSAVDASGFSAGLSYGKVISKDEISRPVFSAGAGLKYIGSRLGGASASTFALDFGGIYHIRPDNYWLSKIPGQEFRLAAAVRDLGPGLKYDSGSTPLPTALSVGGSWYSHPGGNSELIVSLDNVLQAGDGYYVALGTEFTAFQLLSFRAGFRTGQQAGSGIRAGVGFHLSFIDLDYSMSPFGDLGSMHKFGLSMRFGEGKAAQPLAGPTSRAETASMTAPKDQIEKLQLYANDLLDLARKDIDERRYMEALAEMRRAFNLEPGLRDGAWGGRETRLQAVISGLRIVETEGKEKLFSAPGDQAATAARAVSEYIEGRELLALLLAHAARGADMRGPAVFEELLNVISSLSNLPVRRNEVLPLAAMIQKKLDLSEAAFKQGDFQDAARQCEEVLLLDPAQVLVWKRLGSAYYALGDIEQAKRAYHKVLELDPQDPSVTKFMEVQGWK